MTSSLDALTRTSDQLYDDLLLPDETVKIRAEAREFATTVLAPRAAELNSAEESKAAFPRDILDAMTAGGLYTIPFASDVGGRGLQYPMLAAATVLEELAYYTPGVASALYDVQAMLVGRTLDAAPAHTRGEYLSRLVRGEIVGSFATSEPDASTDLSAEAMRTTATRVTGGYRLNGASGGSPTRARRTSWPRCAWWTANTRCCWSTCTTTQWLSANLTRRWATGCN